MSQMFFQLALWMSWSQPEEQRNRFYKAIAINGGKVASLALAKSDADLVKRALVVHALSGAPLARASLLLVSRRYKKFFL